MESFIGAILLCALLYFVSRPITRQSGDHGIESVRWNSRKGKTMLGDFIKGRGLASHVCQITISHSRMDRYWVRLGYKTVDLVVDSDWNGGAKFSMWSGSVKDFLELYEPIMHMSSSRTMTVHHALRLLAQDSAEFTVHGSKLSALEAIQWVFV